jgi:hypothetical protein
MSAYASLHYFLVRSYICGYKIRIHNVPEYWKCKILKQHQVELQFLRLKNDFLHICILDEACNSNGMLPAVVVFVLWKKELCLLIF